MQRKRVKNPLGKRVLRELIGDWKKYGLISLFLILIIGFVSGMYVANGSMTAALDKGVEEYRREDGHFELAKAADTAFLSAAASGQRAAVKEYYLEQAKKTLDAQFPETFRQRFEAAFPGQSAQAGNPVYDQAYAQAYDAAWNEAAASVAEKYAEAKDKYGLEDADFAPVPVTLYENFYKNAVEDKDADGTAEGQVRVYQKNETVNLASVLEGRLPETASEIAIDRMHADNLGLKVGDTLRAAGQDYEIVGLIAYVNYSTLHENPTDFMFDALKFDVAMVTAEGFDRLDAEVHYNYAWRYVTSPADAQAEKTQADNFLKALVTQTVTADNTLKAYTPAYANPALTFAPEDMGSDEVMGGVLLNIFTVIIAFIFGVTISGTIQREAETVGTLRASGYTRGELLRHYLAVPVAVTLFSAVVGNLLGYTLFKHVVVGMYYNSYSLPAYKTLWNADAFLKTTLLPAILMLLVNLAVIVRMLRHTPLQFLRRDLKRSRKRGALRLPKWQFLSRFRIRIVLQNLSNYAVLFLGILFVAILLALSVGMPESLKYYKDNADDVMFARYQYILKDSEDDQGQRVQTANGEAEKFSVTTLEKQGEVRDEEVSVYGIAADSRYVTIRDLKALKAGEVYISAPLAEKYRLSVGDSLPLTARYENSRYDLKVAGIYEHCQSMAAFMDISHYNTIFDAVEGDFDGYLSNTEISDIDGSQIATVITREDIMKMCDQLDHSMGSYMTYFQILCILLAAVLTYLLTKIIIEKNERAIAMAKILGYDNRELAGLYLLTTTVVVLAADAVCVFWGGVIIKQVWRSMMAAYSGWFSFIITPQGYGRMFIFIFFGYLAVMLLDFRRIRKISLEKALKDMD